MKKEYPIAFYISLLAFMYAAFFGRAFLQPAMHGIQPWLSVVAFLGMPFIYQNLVTRGSVGRFFAGISFFLMFVFFWETMNIVPILFMGLSLITKGFFHSFMGIDYALPYIKTVAILITLFIARKHWLGFISTLFASKHTDVHINGEVKKAALFYNAFSGIVSVYYPRKRFFLPRIDYIYEGNPLLLFGSSRPPIERDSGLHQPVYQYGEQISVWSKKGAFEFNQSELPKHWINIFDISTAKQEAHLQKASSEKKKAQDDEIISF